MLFRSRRIGLCFAGLACLLGYQLIVFALFTKVFAITEGFQPMPVYLDRLFAHVTLELGIVAGLLLTLAGLGTLVAATLRWDAAGFGTLDPTLTMRVVIPGAVLLVLGIQTIFSSFLLESNMNARPLGVVSVKIVEIGRASCRERV